MSHQAISAALSSHLAAMPDLPPVAWENAEFQPVDGESFLRESFLPGNGGILGMGDTGSNSFTGVYQISVFTKLGDYKLDAQNLVTDIADHFRRGQRITHSGQSVTLERVDMAQGRKSGGWWFVPVSIRWRAASGNV